MNNLLRVLTDGQNTLDPELRTLLSSVKEARRQLHSHDTKISDVFYDSLDGLLQDLRTVTPDNRDAEAFLKPVSKSEVPDYYDVIHSPMDLQTMQRKVKQKQYKSKREFQDDLDLIWSNCLTYNATDNHPLRLCATRLKVKAECLLKNITDRKERLDPHIPTTLSRSGTPKVNGINGHSVSRPRPVAFTKSPSPSKLPSTSSSSRQPRSDLPFPESPAIVRTAEDMSTFLQLHTELDARLSGELLANGFHGPSLEEKLKEFVGPTPELDGDEGGFMAMDVDVGEKRKLNGHSDARPRKRARMGSVEKDATELWWDAMQSDTMIGNALPILRYASSEEPSSSNPPTSISDPPRRTVVRTGKKRKKRGPGPEAEKTLLFHMNSNIRTFRRIQTAHAKLAMLKETTAADESQQSGDHRPMLILPPALNDIEDTVDDRPWRSPGSGLELGEENANDCLQWMSSKVLQHVGFQGTSKVALDVMVGIAADYLNSLGRTIKFLVDKYANKMSAEEIILHALFGSGTARVNELERYITDDILRSGTRLAEMEKKLHHAYEEATSNEAWDDGALFRAEDDEEEEGEFVMGNFADSFGEDFLGLRELGIAEEFGLSTLTIPKKLLKGKNRGGLKDPAAAKPTEPPPPFPPPPPFVPLDSKHLDDQIGLLRPYYQQRIESITGSNVHPPAPLQQLTNSTALSISPDIPNSLAVGPPIPSSTALVPRLPSPTPVLLPDDTAPPAHTKIGPLGQIVKSAPTAASSKKKVAAKPKALPAPGIPADSELPAETPAATPTGTAPETPRKPKGTPAKKKKNAIEILPPVIAASA
ncbi:hypothetical protein BDW22DRAFT_1356046 [Trametopsis cervina]|nr:hypothetical protein BDW22DRAFT_1356046 [Trametopsis cervina]